MKTLEQWEYSREYFENFATPGDEIDEEIYYYFLEVLPPATITRKGFLVGEPYDHNGQGEAMFSTFYQYPGNKYVYGGIKTIKEFKEEGTQ